MTPTFTSSVYANGSGLSTGQGHGFGRARNNPAHESDSAGSRYVTASGRKTDEGEDDADDRALLAEAHERFRSCLTWENDFRRSAEEELNFVDHLLHWDQSMVEERKGRPCLKYDRIGPAVDQVVNDARQNPPEPRYSPVGGGADKETAEVLQGLLRNIENDSEAEIAYMVAYEHAVKVGRGWWRVFFDWEDDTGESFDQKILIGTIPNLFSVYPDPSACKWDYSDMRYAFVTDDLDRRTFKDLYGDSTAAGLSDFEGLGDRVKADWFPKGSVRVAEYWYTRQETKKVALLSTGEVIPAEEVGDAQPQSYRTVVRNRVFCAKITGLDILSKTEWPGRWIPLIPVLGRQSIRNGKRTLRGMIRAAMDPNLHYDYLRSKEAEAVGLAPIAPFMVAEGQIEGYEWKWDSANKKAWPFLEYKNKVGGELVPPPQRISADVNIQGLAIAIAGANDDVKASTQTYDANLGAPGPESSGRAILARQREGDNAHFHYHDNLSRAMRHTGRVILDLVPEIYNEERLLTIADPDGSSKEVKINGPTVHEGIARIFDLASKVARYHVTISSAPSYASRRAEGKEALIELTRTMPQAMVRALDLVVKSLDIPDGDQVASRLKPPDVTDSEDADPRQLLSQAQQQLQQMTALNQHLMQALKTATDGVEIKRLQMATQERVAALQEETKLRVARLKAASTGDQAQLDAEIGMIRAREDALNASAQTANPEGEPGPPPDMPGHPSGNLAGPLPHGVMAPGGPGVPGGMPPQPPGGGMPVQPVQ